LGTLLLADCKKEPVEGVYDNGVLGASAKDLLWSSPYSALQIEMQYMPCYERDPQSVNNVGAGITGTLNFVPSPDGNCLADLEVNGGK
jgi:hypothetical protein